MNDLILTNSFLSPEPYWENPILDPIDEHWISSSHPTHLFDQNGYDLCPLEIMYAKYNQVNPTIHRNDTHIAIKYPWFEQEEKLSGYVLNHSLLFERKGYTGRALEQIKKFSKINPLIYKVVHMKSKWGIDFSLDYVDKDHCFEIFHYEYDSFNYEDMMRQKIKVENMIKEMDFDDVVRDLIERKQEWVKLEFFDQSEWKCKYFGIDPERFKMVVWE